MNRQIDCDEIVIVERRYRGPSDSGNGGYVSGLLAARIEGAAEITLRQPPPLEKELCIKSLGEGRFQLLDGEMLIAEGRPGQVQVEVPRCLSFEEAQLASRDYVGFEKHIFPTCFVCSPQRSDGLRIFAGPVKGRDLVAAPWIPPTWLADEHGFIQEKYLWAALDCPGYYAIPNREESISVLGRMTANVNGLAQPGMKLVALGWYRSSEGRKTYVGTALCNTDGKVLAKAEAVWIRLEQKGSFQ